MITNFYVYEKEYENPRNCEFCDTGMADGFLHEETNETFCSVICLSEVYGIQSVALRRTGIIFYTEWYDEIKTLCERCSKKAKLNDCHYCASCSHELEG